MPPKAASKNIGEETAETDGGSVYDSSDAPDTDAETTGEDHELQIAARAGTKRGKYRAREPKAKAAVAADTVIWTELAEERFIMTLDITKPYKVKDAWQKTTAILNR